MPTEFTGVLPNLIGIEDQRRVRTMDGGWPVATCAPSNTTAVVASSRKALLISIATHATSLFLLAFAQPGSKQLETHPEEQPHQSVTILYPANQLLAKAVPLHEHPVPGATTSTPPLSTRFRPIEKSVSTADSARGTVDVGAFDRLPTKMDPRVPNPRGDQVVIGGLEANRLIQDRRQSGAVAGPTNAFTPSMPATGPVDNPQQLERDVPARLLSAPQPSYSQEAQSLNLTGEVLLEVKLMSSGEVRVLRILSGLGHGLDEEAVEAAKRTRCLPARRAGRSVDVVATIRVVFKLS